MANIQVEPKVLRFIEKNEDSIKKSRVNFRVKLAKVLGDDSGYDVKLRDSALYDRENYPMDQWIVNKIPANEHVLFETLIKSLEEEFEIGYEWDQTTDILTINISHPDYLSPIDSIEYATLKCLAWILVFSILSLAIFLVK